MTKLRTKLIRTRDHVITNRGKIGFSVGLAVGVTAGAVVIVKQAEAWNDWLESMNLTDLYYNFSDELRDAVTAEVAAGAYS